MAFIFNADQLLEIQSRLLAAQSTNNYIAVYDYIFEQITDNYGTANEAPKANVDKSVWIWARGAYGVNDPNENNLFSDFIRDYTAKQYELRYGGTIEGTGLLQDTSNEIAERFAEDIIASSNGEFPPLSKVGEIDAGEAASRVFIQNPIDGIGNFSPWAGTILFPFLGEGRFTSEWLLTSGTNEFKKIPGTYDLISVAQASWAVTTSLSPDSLEEVITAITQQGYAIANNNIGENATLQLLASLRGEASDFFQNYYGLPNLGEYQIGGDLPLYGLGVSGADFLLRPNYKVGLLGNDTMVISGDESAGNDIVNLGLGDDYVVQGSLGNDLIDGAEGTDTVDYLRNVEGLDVKINALSLGHEARYIAEVQKYKGIDLTFTDLLYNFEIFKGSDQQDTFIDAAGENEYDGLAGVDKLSYAEQDLLQTSGGQSGIRIVADLAKGEVERSLIQGGQKEFDKITNIEQIIGASGDDVFKGKEGVVGQGFTGNGQTTERGDKVDFSDYTATNGGVTVDLGAETGSDGNNGTYTL